MFKRVVAEGRIRLRIVTEGPLLIKSGRRVEDDPDMQALRSLVGGAWHPIIPGSSLKGTIRSHAERLLRTLTPENQPACCNPFEKDRASPHYSCGERLEHRHKVGQRVPADRAYRYACAACRLFGSTHCAGRLAVDDAPVRNQTRDFRLDGPVPIVGRYQVEVRDGVGIDRWTGGAAPGIKFTLEAVTNAVFETTLHLENPELWQIGLLGQTLLDLQDGWIRLGSTRTRGFGAVRGQVLGVDLAYLRPYAADRLRGIGRLVSSEERDRYGFLSGAAEEAPLPAGVEPQPRGLRTLLEFVTPEQQGALWQAGWRALEAAAPGFYASRVAQGGGRS